MSVMKDNICFLLIFVIFIFDGKCLHISGEMPYYPNPWVILGRFQSSGYSTLSLELSFYNGTDDLSFMLHTSNDESFERGNCDQKLDYTKVDANSTIDIDMPDEGFIVTLCKDRKCFDENNIDIYLTPKRGIYYFFGFTSCIRGSAKTKSPIKILQYSLTFINDGNSCRGLSHYDNEMQIINYIFIPLVLLLLAIAVYGRRGYTNLNIVTYLYDILLVSSVVLFAHVLISMFGYLYFCNRSDVTSFFIALRIILICLIQSLIYLFIMLVSKGYLFYKYKLKTSSRMLLASLAIVHYVLILSFKLLFLLNLPIYKPFHIYVGYRGYYIAAIQFLYLLYIIYCLVHTHNDYGQGISTISLVINIIMLYFAIYPLVFTFSPLWSKSGNIQLTIDIFDMVSIFIFLFLFLLFLSPQLKDKTFFDENPYFKHQFSIQNNMHILNEIRRSKCQSIVTTSYNKLLQINNIMNKLAEGNEILYSMVSLIIQDYNFNINMDMFDNKLKTQIDVLDRSYVGATKIERQSSINLNIVGNNGSSNNTNNNIRNGTMGNNFNNNKINAPNNHNNYYNNGNPTSRTNDSNNIPNHGRINTNINTDNYDDSSSRNRQLARPNSIRNATNVLPAPAQNITQQHPNPPTKFINRPFLQPINQPMTPGQMKRPTPFIKISAESTPPQNDSILPNQFQQVNDFSQDNDARPQTLQTNNNQIPIPNNNYQLNQNINLNPNLNIYPPPRLRPLSLARPQSNGENNSIRTLNDVIGNDIEIGESKLI